MENTNRADDSSTKLGTNNLPAKKMVGQEMKKIKKEAKEKTAGYILAALGLVAGLAWNDAVKALIDYLLPLGKNGILAKFLYAVLITVFVIVVASYITRLLMRDEENGKE